MHLGAHTVHAIKMPNGQKDSGPQKLGNGRRRHLRVVLGRASQCDEFTRRAVYSNVSGSTQFKPNIRPTHPEMTG